MSPGHSSSQARAAIQDNIESLGLQGRAKVFRRDATKLGSIGTMKPFDLVFLDPPYGKGLAERAVVSLVEGNWLLPKALVILEEHVAAFPETLDHFDLIDQRQFGDTKIGIFCLEK